MRWDVIGFGLALVLAQGGCGGGDASSDPDAAPGADLLAPLHVRVVATLPPTYGLAIAPLDGGRIALAESNVEGDVLCPDCVGLDPAECPAVCKRAVVSVAVVDTTTGEIASPRTVQQVFPSTFDDSVDQVAAASLGGDRVAVAWLDCDDSACMGLFARRSCTARMITVDVVTGDVSAPQTLYERWFGDLRIAFEPTTRRLLATVGKELAFGSGLRAAMFDETGAQQLEPWVNLGGDGVRGGAIGVDSGRLVIAADDHAPDRPPPPVCVASCDCLAAGPIDVATGGLHAYRIEDAWPPVAERVALGVQADGFYYTREVIAPVGAGGRFAIATSQSIDREAEIFVADDAGWQRRLGSPAPLPTWVGALAARDHFAWLGVDPDPGNASLQRLVAGVVDGDATARGPLTDPLESSILLVAPVATASGVTTTYLLRGVFGHTDTGLVWDRFELVDVTADWP